MKFWPLLFVFAVKPLYAAEKNPGSSSMDEAVGKTLNDFHKAAAAADLEKYFSFFSQDGVFIGTDAGERWTVKEFRDYAAPHFAKGRGWTYIPEVRHISFSPGKDVAWFDESLRSESYGTSRGTGVLVKEGQLWKIAQYHLTFPIPNDLAEKFTTEIKAYEKAKKKPK